MGRDGVLWGPPSPQPPHLLSWQASVPGVTLCSRKRSEHCPLQMGHIMGADPPAQTPWGRKGALTRAPGGPRGPSTPCRREPRSAVGHEGVLGAHPLHTRTPGSPAEHYPSCCPITSHISDPALTLSPGSPGEPVSPRAPFAPSSPGSPGSPYQGRALWLEGAAPTPAQMPAQGLC